MISPVRLPVALMLLTLSPSHVTHIKKEGWKKCTAEVKSSPERPILAC